MTAVDILTAKRDGQALAPEAIAWLVDTYTRNEVPDYQMAAFLMAGFLNGFDEREAAALTRAMLHSGRVLDLSDIPGTKVDKHSTGGVGDKVSLVLAPLVAACGVPVPMISGRGLGHTGGTLDKLESIPGFNVSLDIDAYRKVLADVGVVMIGQTKEIAPADKKLYALRDVTATVESIPLIAASIMSKKLAEGIDALVLDVKCGRGAFMKEEKDARRLAEALVGIGLEFEKPTVALLTAMDAPLGRAIGNGPEAAEAITALRNETPRGGAVPRFLEVVLSLAGEMIALGGKAETPDEGRKTALTALEDGSALRKFHDLIDAQDGDLSTLDNPTKLHGEPALRVTADDAMRGFVNEIDSFTLGRAAVDLGAGRAKKEDSVDPKAGFVLHKTVGDAIKPGELLVEVFASNPSKAAEEPIQKAFTISESEPSATPVLLDRYDGIRWRGKQKEIPAS